MLLTPHELDFDFKDIFFFLSMHLISSLECWDYRCMSLYCISYLSEFSLFNIMANSLVSIWEKKTLFYRSQFKMYNLYNTQCSNQLLKLHYYFVLFVFQLPCISKLPYGSCHKVTFIIFISVICIMTFVL